MNKLKKNKKTKFHKKNKESIRKLQINPDDDIFLPLKIFLDYTNFNHNFPYDTLGAYKNYFIEAIENAKYLLEKFIKINTDIFAVIKNYGPVNLEDWGLDVWDNETFQEKMNLSTYNYYILFRFNNSINGVASSYIWDEYSAPTIGVITINDEKILEKSITLDYLKNLMMQQFIYLMGFQIDTNEFTNDIIEVEEELYYISIDNCPIFFDYAKKYFSCNKIEKVYFELDEDNNLRWPSRLFLGEIMTNLDYPEEKVLSRFTLAYLEDLGYFKIDKKYTGGLFRFGKNKGCKFFFGDCGRDLEYDTVEEGLDETKDITITFANEFFLPKDNPSTSEPSCSSGRLSKTIYRLHNITQEVGDKCQYLLGDETNGYSGGLKKVNYCPIAEYNTETSTNLYTGSCFDSSTSVDISYHEELGEDSFCILSSLLNGNNYKAVCHKMFCSLQSLTIRVGDYYIVCPRSGGKIKPDNFTGYLLCPDYNLICTGTKMCNNIFDCIEKESEEKEDTFNYSDYEIKTTQNSSYYNSDPVIIESAWELANNGTCPYLCMQCDLNYKCTKCAPHYKVFNTEENECLNAVPNCANYTEDEGDICNQCADGYSLVKEYNNTIVCISDTIIDEQKYYYKPNGSELYYRCNNSISSCVKCLSEDECISCEEGYYLLEGSDNKITCENIDTSKCYSVSTTDKTYYVKCDRNMDNCDTCSGSGACTTCKTNYVFIEDDHTKCEDFTTQKYYYDSSTEKYRLCANGLDNCGTCVITNDNFICKQCKSDYVFKHEINIECALKSNLISNNQFYTNDSEVNYYSCQFYNDIEKCLECNDKETCTNCQGTYTLVNLDTINNKACILQEDIDEHKYYHDTTTDIYKKCSNLISKCNKCTDENICIECLDDYKLEEHNTCIPNSDVTAHLYYLNNDTNKYVSCSSISQCKKCLSADECISCVEGYFLLEGSGSLITCQNVDITKCYLKSTTDKTYYVKCDRDIDNCDTCTSSSVCTTCKTNYVFVEDDHTKCEDFTTQKYYYDSSTEKYRLCANGLDNCGTCAITNDNFICKQCKSDYVFKHEINIECALKSSLINNNQFYTNDSQINYYSCKLYNDIEKCLECNNKEACTNCQDTYTLVNLNTINNKACILQEDIDEHKYYHDTTTDIYTKCSNIISECNKCSNSTTCTECLGDAKLEEHNICIPNSDVIAHLYYLDVTSHKYASCSKISQCKTCLSSTNCTLCNDGYVIIEENSITTCEDFSTKKYYYDSLLNKYKECSYKFRNCEKCVVEGGNNFVCEECKSNYVFKHDNNLECSLKSELETNKEFYTNDSGKNYFSCSNSLYNDVHYCKECDERSKCTKCQSDYKLVNQNTKCISQRDVDNKIIYFNPDTLIYSECSDLINLCHKCDNETTCTQCGNDGALEENDKCINKTLVENNNYFINEATHKYVSCSIINNCIKCSSSTTCLECQEGFQIKDNICQSTSGSSSSNNNNKDDNKLSTGAIVGIVLGILGFLLIAAGLVYFLLNKYRKKQTLPSTIPDEEKMEEKIKEKMEEKEKEIEKKSERDDVSSNKLNDIEKINVKTKKRSIHNY